MSLHNLNLMNPVTDHHLNQGLLTWHLKVPGMEWGSRSLDLTRQHDADNTGFSGTQASRFPRRQGGVASWPFNGTAEIDFGNVEALKLLSTAFTLSCWVYWPSANTNNNVGLMSKYGITNSRAWALVTANTATFTQGSVSFFYQSNASSFNSNERLNTGSFVIDDDAWHHVVATFEPSTATAIYVDGIVRASTTSNVPASVADHSADCYFGRYAANEFAGYMDDFRIYDRALSIGEVGELYLQSQLGYADLIEPVTRPEIELIFLALDNTPADGAERPLYIDTSQTKDARRLESGGLLNSRGDVYPFVNNSGAQIDAGKFVRIDGSGNMALATNASTLQSALVTGVVLGDTADSATGLVQVGGVVRLSESQWGGVTSGTGLLTQTDYFLGSAGNILSSPPSSAVWNAPVGQALSSTDFLLRIQALTERV